MFILFCVLAAVLLLGLAGVGLSLMELDRRLLDLAKAMETRYGAVDKTGVRSPAGN